MTIINLDIIELRIVDGYPDGTFKPSNKVNKAEFLKMLVESMQIDINPNIANSSFIDVKETDWFAPYVQFAVEKNIIDVDSKRFNPTEKMARDEVAEAMYRVKILTETGAAKYSPPA